MKPITGVTVLKDLNDTHFQYAKNKSMDFADGSIGIYTPDLISELYLPVERTHDAAALGREIINLYDAKSKFIPFISSSFFFLRGPWESVSYKRKSLEFEWSAMDYVIQPGSDSYLEVYPISEAAQEVITQDSLDEMALQLVIRQENRF